MVDLYDIWDLLYDSKTYDEVINAVLCYYHIYLGKALLLGGQYRLGKRITLKHLQWPRYNLFCAGDGDECLSDALVTEVKSERDIQRETQEMPTDPLHHEMLGIIYFLLNVSYAVYLILNYLD